MGGLSWSAQALLRSQTWQGLTLNSVPMMVLTETQNATQCPPFLSEHQYCTSGSFLASEANSKYFFPWVHLRKWFGQAHTSPWEKWTSWVPVTTRIWVSGQVMDSIPHRLGLPFFWLHCVACRILIPQSGIEAQPSAVKAQSPNHWTTREFPSWLRKAD